MNSQNPKLVEQHKALDDFFDSLMQDVQNYAETELVSPVLAPPPLIMPLPPVAPPPVIEAPVIPAPVETPPLVVEPTTSAATSTTEEISSTEKPAWAHSPFQVLLFKVAGLTLAVPLLELNGVVEWREGAITRMPGHADFYMGLVRHLEHNVALVDTARLVMPADRLTQLAADDPYTRASHIVLIHDSCYGLACDEIAEVVTLQPDDVRWRTSRTQRRWLAGTVVSQMCALIDAPAFARMLAERLPVKAFRE